MKRRDNARNPRRPCSGGEKRLSLLVVSSFPDDFAQLREMLGKSRWEVQLAGSRQQALGLLKANPVAVVICERELPDGCWRDLLDAPSRAGRVPLLIVTSRLADEGLWVEVLSAGGFDVIAKPLSERDVRWAVASARREHQQQIATSLACGGGMREGSAGCLLGYLAPERKESDHATL